MTNDEAFRRLKPCEVVAYDERDLTLVGGFIALDQRDSFVAFSALQRLQHERAQQMEEAREKGDKALYDTCLLQRDAYGRLLHSMAKAMNKLGWDEE